ncbi:MAG: thioredoxin [Saprospiraceae bacterium]|nr:thioredoxin [Saprospiraceae bacterium]
MSFQELISSDVPLLIDFYADWCGPCRVLSPIIQDIKNDLGEQIKVVKIDVDANQSLSTNLDVMSIPTIMIYKKGELLWRAAGVQTKQAILKQLQPHLN